MVALIAYRPPNIRTQLNCIFNRRRLSCRPLFILAAHIYLRVVVRLTRWYGVGSQASLCQAPMQLHTKRPFRNGRTAQNGPVTTMCRLKVTEYGFSSYVFGYKEFRLKLLRQIQKKCHQNSYSSIGWLLVVLSLFEYRIDSLR